MITLNIHNKQCCPARRVNSNAAKFRQKTGNKIAFGRNNGIQIHDVTLRDGNQTPGACLRPNQKLTIAKQLDELGVDVIQVGFPASSQWDFEATKMISEEVKRPTLSTFCRCKKLDIDAALKATKKAKNHRLHISLPGSLLHMQKIGKTKEGVMEMMSELIPYAKKWCNDIQVGFEDASRAKPDNLYPLVKKAITLGASTVNIPDTVGYSTPTDYGELFKDIRKSIPEIDKMDITLSTHCHDDMGLATANTISALQAGARQIEVTMNGMGERAGNAPLEQVSTIINVRKDLFKGNGTNIKLQKLFETAKLVEQEMGTLIAANQPLIGANAFSHESGMHQNGLTKNPRTYQAFYPEMVRRKLKFTLGPQSGRSGILKAMERLKLKAIPAEKMADFYEQFMQRAQTLRKISDDDFIRLYKQFMKNL